MGWITPFFPFRADHSETQVSMIHDDEIIPRSLGASIGQAPGEEHRESTAGNGIQQGNFKCSPSGSEQVLLPFLASLLYRALPIKCSYYFSDLIFDCGHNQHI